MLFLFDQPSETVNQQTAPEQQTAQSADVVPALPSKRVNLNADDTEVGRALFHAVRTEKARLGGASNCSNAIAEGNYQAVLLSRTYRFTPGGRRNNSEYPAAYRLPFELRKVWNNNAWVDCPRAKVYAKVMESHLTSNGQGGATLKPELQPGAQMQGAVSSYEIPNEDGPPSRGKYFEVL